MFIYWLFIGCLICLYIHTDIKKDTDRQTDRETERQTDTDNRLRTDGGPSLFL